jgi:hypothetical protein
MNTCRRFAGIIVSLAAALLLASCSTVKLGYNSLPNVAYWWLDGYIDFTDLQEPAVRTEITKLHAWHRDQELPRLADMLSRMEKIAPGPVTAQQACGFVTEVQGRIDVLAEQAEPAILATALALTPEQLQHLKRKYARNNDKFRKDWVAPSPEDLREKRFDQLAERMEWLYGRLDEPQRKVLRAQIEHSTYDSARILAERLRRQQDMLQTLQRVSEPGVTSANARILLRGYVDRALRSPDPAFRAWQEKLLQENCRTFAAVHDSTTPAQREQAAKRLRGYQSDLRELSAQR